MATKLYTVALSMIHGIGDALGKQLISYCGSAEAVFTTRKGKLLKVPGIGYKLASAIISSNTLPKAEEELQKAEANNTQILTYFDKEYPHRLKHIIDAPLFIYYKGKANLNASKVVSIVGTRQATDYGKSIVDEFVADLAKYGNDILIISGLAYGIDITAHRSCLKYGVPTIGIMANGMDKVYPAVHKKTADEMLKNGGLITENAFGSKPDAPKFPERNRIIAGMSDAVIVPEAMSKGGALITAEIAYSYDREVFAVPGGIHNKPSIGCNNLIKQHKARIITKIADLEYMMNWDIENPKQKPISTPQITLTLNPQEKTVVNLLSKGEMQIDELCFKAQVPIHSISSVLLGLEMEGIVKSLPGKRFALNLKNS